MSDGWTMVCPSCKTALDENGYCTDVGCPECGKCPPPVPLEWIDPHSERTALMEIRGVVVQVEDEELLTFDRLPEVRRELEDRLTGMPIIGDGARQLAWIKAANVVLGGLPPRDATLAARRAQAAMDLLDECRESLTDMAGGFRCSEAETIAEFIKAWGTDTDGDAFLLSHAHGDDQPGDLHAVVDGKLVTREG